MTQDQEPMTDNLKRVRQETEKAQEGLSPEQIKEHEKNLFRGVFEAWPELLNGGCEVLNELFKEQVALAQAADPTPYKVKAVRPDALRAAVDERGTDALSELLGRIEQHNREVLRRIKRLAAERDALRAERDALSARLAGTLPPS